MQHTFSGSLFSSREGFGPSERANKFKKMNFQNIKDDFEKNGIVRIPGVFSIDEVNKMRAEGLMSLSRFKESTCPRVKLQVKETDGVSFPAIAFFPAITSKYLNKIRTDERLASIAREILGGDIKQLNNQLYYRLPGDGDEFEWHQDILFRNPIEDFPGIESSYLQTIVVIDEIHSANGPVQYVFGSHKKGDLNLLEKNENTPKALRSFTPSKFNGTAVLAMPGDVLIWSVLTVHGSTQNRSTTPRMTYMNGFARADASKHFPNYMIGGKVIDTLDIQAFPENKK